MAQFESSEFNIVRGKVGGMVFQGSSSGPIMRARTVPRQPRSDAQVAVRNSFTNASAAWAELPLSFQAGWANVASQITLKNRLGKVYHPTGRRLFIACFQNAATARIPAPQVPPSAAPKVPSAPNFNVSVTAPDGTHLDGEIALGSVFGQPPYWLVLRATGALSFDKRFVGPSDFRVLTVASLAGAPPDPAGLASEYADRFGPLQADARICFEGFLVDSGGFVGPVSRSDVTVLASAAGALRRAA